VISFLESLKEKQDCDDIVSLMNKPAIIDVAQHGA
jgi:hypothetical protein